MKITQTSARMIFVVACVRLTLALNASAQVIRPGDAARAGQMPQERMEEIARKLNLGAKRADSKLPQTTASGTVGGYYQCFERGCVYYSAGIGAHGVSGAIFTKYVSGGYERGPLGFPVGDEQACTQPAGFRYQIFEHGRIVLIGATGAAVSYPNPSAIGDGGNCAIPSGRFRVTLNGFKVNRESEDHMLEVDGKGDEVYVVADVVEIDGEGHAKSPRRRMKTAIFGDTNGWSGRIQAGSRSDKGGLQTGDKFPSEEPWRQTGTFFENSLPMLLFDGELTSKMNAVIVIPTLWEWDGGSRQYTINGDMDVIYERNFDSFLQLMSQHLTATQEPKALFDFRDPETRPLTVPKSWVRRSTNGGTFDDFAFDAPAGAVEFVETARNGDEEHWITFSPDVLLLTYESARTAASYRSNKGPGIIEVRYSPHERRVNLWSGGPAGDYTLYLQVERLP